MLDNKHLVRMTLDIANWCRSGGLDVNELNINRYLAAKAGSLNRVDIMRIYDLMLPDTDPYSIEPVTIHRRRSPQYWVPAKSNDQCVVARKIYLGSAAPYGLYDAKPSFISKELIDEHEEWKRKKALEEKEIEVEEPTGKSKGKTTIVLSTMWID